jgi:hypothetical protein
MRHRSLCRANFFHVHLTEGGFEGGGIGIVSHVMGSRAKVSVSWGCSSEPRKDNANGEFATIIMLLGREENGWWGERENTSGTML